VSDPIEYDAVYIVLLNANTRSSFPFILIRPKDILEAVAAVLRSQKRSKVGRFCSGALLSLWRKSFGLRFTVDDSSRSTAPSVNPQTRDVAEREADQNRNQWVLADLPRNGSARATTRIHDVLRHSARLRSGLLCRLACVAQHFLGLTGRS
jgi:hypothetical protein